MAYYYYYLYFEGKMIKLQLKVTYKSQYDIHLKRKKNIVESTKLKATQMIEKQFSAIHFYLK